MFTIDWTAVGSIATTLAATATWWTVREIRRQSSASMKPELTLLTTDVYVRSERHTEPDFTPLWKAVAFKDGSTSEEPFCLRFVNIGLGSAKHVSIEWKYNIYDIIATASNLGIGSDFKVEDKSSNVIFVSNGKAGFNESIYKKQSYDACLGIEHQPRGIRFSMPPFLMFLIDSAISKLFTLDGQYKSDLNQQILGLFGANEISVKYTDLQDNRFEKIYKVQLDLKAYSANHFDGQFTTVFQQ